MSDGKTYLKYRDRFPEKECKECHCTYKGKSDNYCSLKCASVKRIGKKLSMEVVDKMVKNRYGGYRRREIECSSCSKKLVRTFHRLNSKNYFCSMRCHGDFMSKNGVPQIIPFRFKKGQQSLNGMLGKRHTIETLFKMSISHGSGESNKRWVHDRTKLRTSEKHMNDTRYKYWSIEVKNRDGWTCRMSDHNCSGRIEAHHILGWRDYPELRYKIKNGITLCLSHHPRKRENEKELSTFFQNLVEGERK